MRYQTRPLQVEAVQYGETEEIGKWLNGLRHNITSVSREEVPLHMQLSKEHARDDPYVRLRFVDIDGSEVTVDPGDWLVLEDGRLRGYPPAAFERRFERVE